MKIAKERKSAVLESNAIHHRVDSLTGIVALSTIAISNIIPSLSSLDAVGGLLISYMVVRAGWANTMTSLTELADASIPAEMKTKVLTVAGRAISESLTSGAEARKVNGTKAGQNYYLDVTVTVPGDQTVEQLNKVETLIRERVATNVRGARRIRVRFVPGDAEQGEFTDEFVPPSVNALVTPEVEKVGEHENHDHDHDDHKHEDSNVNGGGKKDL